jgi:hypothetical protein
MSLTRNGFQTRVNRQLPPYQLGGFVSQNPRATALAGPGGFRSGNGLNYLSGNNLAVVGNFAWGAGQYAGSQKPTGASVLGFVANELQTVIPFPAANDPNYPNPVRLAVEVGFDVTLFTHSDNATLPAGAVNGIVSAGDTVYARQYDGAPTNDPTAFSATGVGVGANVTISAVTKGFLVPGMVLAGTGVDVGLTVVSQTSGTPGGAGVYVTSTATGFSSTTVTSAAVDTGYKWQSNTVADATFTGVIAAGTGVLTVSAISGTINVPTNGVDGPNLTGTGVPANLFVIAQISGPAGGNGTYQVNSIGPAVSSTTMTTSEGKLAKISRTF